MGRKKLQGVDGMNFGMQLTLDGLQNINLPKNILPNAAGQTIVEIECKGGWLSVFVNLPHAVRADNIQPFQLSDCKALDVVGSRIIRFIKDYLKEHLGKKYSANITHMIYVDKMEINITIRCVGRCKPGDVVNLFRRIFPKSVIYESANDIRKPYNKSKETFTTRQDHEWVLKVYDKTREQRRKGNLNVEPNLIRIEFVFLERMLKRICLGNMSLDNVLTRRTVRAALDQYQTTFHYICETKIKSALSECKRDIVDSLIRSESGRAIQDTVLRYKHYIFDMELLRKALKTWYKSNSMPDNSSRMINYYRKGNYGIPEDVLKTVRQFHISTGKK